MEEAPASSLRIEDLEILSSNSGNGSPNGETASDQELIQSDSDLTTDSEVSSDSDDDEDPLEDYDLATTIMMELKDETYTCLICACEIDHEEQIWPCGSCYRVYHLPCIDSWSKKGSSTDEHGNWKCPSCNKKHRKEKFQARCWCKKQANPSKNPLNPGSCGQTCGVPLKGCIHKCTLQCHPGPHAACNALGPIMKCQCGNHDNQWPCVMTPYKEGWHCEDVCEELLPCEEHKCGKVCHEGLCGKCEKFVETRCYCGKTTDNIKCHSKKPRKSYAKNKEDNWIGNFKCSLMSETLYNCGVHFELKSCESVKRKAEPCPLSPEMVHTCRCGQTSIEELNQGNNRQSCSDPIPTCEKVCNKQLPCGHRCKWLCHEGECSSCLEFIDTKCQCEFSRFIVPCKFLKEGNHATCTRKCTSLLSCRRHRCNKICCADEKAALVRERERKKGIRRNLVANSRNNRDAEAFNTEASHICLQICNKKLSCGNESHTCQQMCHTGPCPPCLESSNNDLICHCGQTVVMAPVRCGTELPECYSQCIRELACGHQQMPHNCHPDNVPCLRCTKTVEKWCNCGKKKVSAMCYQIDVYCGDKCGKLLPCQHRCVESCHSGECVCRSICGKKKKYCDHVDRKACHFPSRCDDTKICNEMVKLTCKCGRIKNEVPCGASASKGSCVGTSLECDVSCIVQERQDQLQMAFGFEKPSSGPKIRVEDIPYTPKTLKTYKLQPRWCGNIEETIKEFMKKSNQSYHFKPMRSEQREFVHELAEVYQLFSESQDPEPQRSVFIMKRQNSISSPLSLSKSLQAYEQHLKEAAKASKRSTSATPEPAPSFEYNGIVIEDCIVGITRTELQETVMPILDEAKLVKNLQLMWIEADKYLVLPEAHMSITRSMELELKDIVPTLKVTLETKFLANTVKLAKVDATFTVVSTAIASAPRVINQPSL